MSCPTCNAALETFRERSECFADEARDPAGYLLGLSDAYADAAGVLEQLAHPGWPEQTDEHPYDRAIGETA